MALENTVFTVDTSEVVEEVLKDRAFYGAKGGLTLSGGEPMQQAQAAIEMLSACRKNGLHTAVETCGYFKKDDLPALAETADLLLWDIKDTDEARHRQNTGVSLAPILQNLYAADRLGIKIRLALHLPCRRQCKRGAFSPCARHSAASGSFAGH